MSQNRLCWRGARLGLIAALAGAWLAGPTAQAQTRAGTAPPRSRPAAADLPEVRTLPVVLSLRPGEGRPRPDGEGLRGPGCPIQVASLTSSNFAPGTYTVQAGFAQTEVAAASYTLPASAFPIKIELMEFLLATASASQQTTTQYSVLVWDGPPNASPPLYEYRSLDGDLPAAIMPPGTTGLHIQVSVDPNDPDQFFISNESGTGTFTIGLRIDQHNAQSGTGCNAGDLPTCCNAFPVTDNTTCQNYTQLNFPNDNWLFGVNCGAGGCPSGGGWARFSQLSPSPFACINAGCRPRGDWVMRASWSSVNCGAPTGACCLPGGTCQVLTSANCQAQGGTYQGDNSACPCPIATGACCFGTNCLNLSGTDCASAGGVYLGDGTACASGQCPTGACCLPNGSCAELSQAACAAQNGLFRGVGVACANANCPPPTGACCLASGGCLLLTQSDCNVIPNSSWAGPQTVCTDGNANGQADVCEPDCEADWNGSGNTTTADISAFLVDWFADVQNGTTVADFNDSGATTTSDISSFLSAWFADVSSGDCGG
ncbi:MAG TPA: hypothetical protein VD963_08990 [Phycisphaerales bacterium]|nr:hypothetical protein [Phycisphaerales bacterium]